METTLEIKRELHEIIEGIADREVLVSALTLLRLEKKLQERTSSPLRQKIENGVTNHYLTLPNGRKIPVEPRNPLISMDELFGIWKDQPIRLEELREKAWGGRA